MTEREIDLFLRESGAVTRFFEEGAVFLRQGDRYDHLAVVINGMCLTEMDDYSGQSISLGRFRAPFPVAPGFLFLEDGRLPVSLRAKTAVTVLFITRKAMFEFLQKNRVFLSNFLNVLSKRVEYLTERVSFHSCRTIREKILLYLETLKTEAGSSVTLPVGIEELARYFGVARPSLSQVLSDLQKEGIIEKKGRTVRIK